MGLKYFFNGKVLPERAVVHITPINAQVSVTETELQLKIVSSILLSQISMHVEIIKGEVDLASLKNMAESFIRDQVDALGFLSGCGYDVEIDTCFNEAGEQIVFGVNFPGLEQIKDKRLVNYETVYQLSNSIPSLRIALGDIREAIRSPKDTGLFSYRAIEALMQTFKIAEDNDKDNLAWGRMQSGLNVSREALMKLKGFGDLPRHGKITSISGDERTSVLTFACQIIDRYCVFAREGNQPLDVTIYPVILG